MNDERRLLSAIWPGTERPVVGMIHLAPLPGAPGFGGDMGAVTRAAIADADVLVEGGVDGLLVENYGDFPFFPGPVPSETTAAMTAVLARLTERITVPLGVNVLRNDVRTALGIAAAVGARFVRCNVHTGTMFTDQGALEGRAWETLRVRAALCPTVAILADVFVKHATPPAGADLIETARDCWERGMPDALIVSGAGTGRPADPDAVRRIRETLPEATIWIGSGVQADNAKDLLAGADGAIVGSAFQRDGRAGAGVEPGRVRALMRELRG